MEDSRDMLIKECICGGELFISSGLETNKHNGNEFNQTCKECGCSWLYEIKVTEV